MQGIRFFVKQFWREPWWFKLLIIASFGVSIVFSSSAFESGYYDAIAKCAAAVFFGAYALKFRRTFYVSAAMTAAAVLCLYVSWDLYRTVGS
ncbi:hypothetical protein [Paenibacillus xanthanilyticus]|uniref:Uncharacterized protein n=1 Tax=Paenibacillus xanthanilyticus TaxID=1783531 RepID=A0ABV8K5X8_9BACL